MKRKILDFSVMKEEISQNNVLEMAELIAFMELRFQIGYLGNRAQKMYADLYGDIKHKNELGYMLSDSYDLVQEGALYLCDHRNKRRSRTRLYFIRKNCFKPEFDRKYAYCLGMPPKRFKLPRNRQSLISRASYGL